MGYDVLSISESTPQACDRDFMMLAEEKGRILLTFDKDFGELAFNSITKSSCGIILFQIPLRSADYIASFIAGILGSGSDWPGNFAVVQPARISLEEAIDLLQYQTYKINAL